MRSLQRNKRTMYYALYVEDKPIIDEYGNETSETEPVYTAPKEFRGNVSAATGEDIAQAFGNFTNYTRVLCVAESDCPIAVRTVVWFGVDVDRPYNYVVTRKADSKNGILYALQEVSVT